ncbi:MAG: hypothetical protein ACXWDJ_10580 [Aeromicrobium sp.]
MAEIGWASLGIVPDMSKFGGDLESGTSKAIISAGTSGGEKFGKSFNQRVKTVAKIGLLGLAATAAAALKFGGDAIEEAREAQKVGALTESTIRATGKAARVTAKHVGDLSSKISDKVGIDDEAIQSGANMLLTFKNIRNEAGEGNKVFDQTLTTLVDLSSAMGTDAKTSAIQLGKALNDPIKGVSALSRVGVTFTEQQKAQIKALVESGRTMDAQKVILRELKSEFGGAAQAQATEADKLSVAWGNFKEEIGTQLLPVMDDLAVFLRKKGIPAAQEFFGWVQDTGIPAMKDFGDEVKPVVGYAKDLVGWLNKLPKPAKIAGLTALFGGIAATKLRGGGVGALGTAGKVIGLAKPVPVFVTNQGFGTPGGAPKKPGALGAVGKLGVAGAVFAGGAYGIKSLFDFHRGGENKPKNGLSFLGGGGVNDFLNPEKPETYSKSLGVLNNSWAKVSGTTDKARESTVLYDGTIRDVPKLWTTVFGAPGLALDMALVKQYGSMLDGLNNRTITTFFKSVQLNKPGDAGDGGTVGQPPNRSGPGVVINHNGNIVANSPREIAQQYQRRARHANGGGVNW